MREVLDPSILKQLNGSARKEVTDEETLRLLNSEKVMEQVF